jgi:hypothetical protein
MEVNTGERSFSIPLVYMVTKFTRRRYWAAVVNWKYMDANMFKSGEEVVVKKTKPKVLRDPPGTERTKSPQS